jgi:5-methylcytosine-specific restriction endonuclease McrBC GTP-binding regulatory subunit McrB
MCCLIRITDTTINNFIKTVIKGVEIENEIKYYWNKPRIKQLKENDSILFFTTNNKKYKEYSNNIYSFKIKKIEEKGEIYNRYLKDLWNDNSEKYSQYIELKKIKEVKDEVLVQNLKNLYKNQNTDMKFDTMKKDRDYKNFENKILNLLNEINIDNDNKEFLQISNLKLENYIINSFYNSLKTKGFVILAGISGSGKTKIFEEFVKCFNTDIKNNLFFPIRPDFKDTKSLLGFYNPLKNNYHSTLLLKFILEASKNYLEKGNDADPFFILFDEMNLARVEYYFADFLSILESKRFECKNEIIENNNFQEFLTYLGENSSEENYRFTSQSIKLHNENITDIPKELFLPPNIYFVGTVNIDETTHMFSPKVLDRAFTIEFDVGNFNDYFNFLENYKNDNNLKDCDLKKDFTNNGNFINIDKSKIKVFLKNNNIYLEKLEEINKILRKYNLHFGYRVFDEIIMFLYNSQNSSFKFDNLDEAFDLAIKMKIFPKLHGTRQKLWNPIIELLKILEIEIIKNSVEDLEKNKEDIYLKIEMIKNIPNIDILKIELDDDSTIQINTNYKYTIHKLLEMLYKLKVQGFASFI